MGIVDEHSLGPSIESSGNGGIGLLRHEKPGRRIVVSSPQNLLNVDYSGHSFHVYGYEYVHVFLLVCRFPREWPNDTDLSTHGKTNFASSGAYATRAAGPPRRLPRNEKG